ncbi:MAG: hypothetical protein JNK64_25120 [Myxococcales bacterium]|nr:hypothetical protein [Myxococcales bacterium]
MQRTLGPWLAVLTVAACGRGATAPTTIGARGGAAPRAAAIVYFPWGQDAVFEADCWAPGADGCAALRAQAEAGGELVVGPARFTLTGRRDEECGASGDVASVVGYRRSAGPDDAYPTVTIYPAGADVGLVIHPTDDASVTPALAAGLAARATADLAGTERARPIAAAEVRVRQALELNVTGGPAPDLLISANVPLPEDNGSGYTWSALVLAVDGDREHLRSLWTSDLELWSVDASYDLDGDGRYAFIWTAAYYEGAASGAAEITDGKLVLGATVGCGA